jgi:pilus assembly protein CpaC
MTRSFLKKFFILLLTLVLSGFFTTRPSADEEANDVMDMIVGDIQSVAVINLSRVSVTDPSVADISDANADKVSIIAKKAGNTVLFVWDGGGKRSIRIRVASQDLEVLKERVRKLLEEAGIEGVALEINSDISKVVLTGELSKDSKNRLTDLLDPYSDDLLNLVQEKKDKDLIQVDMQIVEINTSLEKDLGVLWGNPTSAFTPNSTSSQQSPGSTSSVSIPITETLPTQNGNIGDVFKIGNFYRAASLQATINTLVQEGKARLISKPRLVVENGKQASFLVGGEIPIESTTASSGTGGTLTQNTTYTQYGVNLSVTPTMQDGKIDVLLNVDIRDVDNSTPISSSSGSGNNVAFVTRTASTDLMMDNKQTIVLAGLIKYEDSVQINRFPFLSNIPVLGALFRNRSEPADTNTEMVIILTPAVLTDKKFEEKQIVMPTPDEKASWKEIDSRYPHEPIPSSGWPPVKVDVPALPLATVSNDVPVSPMDAVTAYARLVQEKISKAITYPQSLGAETPAGTVKLKLHILKDGSLDSAEVMQSSGSTVLDQYAMQAAKTAAPYNAFTADMEQPDLIFTIPIVYNKAISSAQAPAEKTIAS